MDFAVFRAAVQKQFNSMKGLPLFRVALDKDQLWATYLASFPEGTNPIYRERREHDCSACRHFIKSVGNMVAIREGIMISLWDFAVGDIYQPVADAMAAFVKAHPIENIFTHIEADAGVAKNFEQLTDGVKTWEHFHISLPTSLVVRGDAVGTKLSEAKAFHDVLLRSLREISDEAIDTVLELIDQDSLYRGAEKKSLVVAFRQMKAQFNVLSNEHYRDLYAWANVQGPNAWVCKIRNDVIGTLLVDISEGKELEIAVKLFEDKVSGTNYKRPTSLITPKMKEAAKTKLTELGLITALERRYAILTDISVENVLFADRNAKKRISSDIFDDLPTKGQNTKKLDKVEEIPIDKFISDVLPKAQSLEVMFENRLTGNLVSLIAPADITAKSLFKWGNPFSWSYNGDVADSIKERVKKAGGNVEGDVCCRLAWYNTDDLDYHMIEPGGYEIYFGNRRQRSPCGGILDLDANGCDGIRSDPAENIYYADKSRMKPGIYNLIVHQYSKRGMDNEGFEAEIDVLGEIHHFSYPQAVRQGANITVAEIQVAKNGEIMVASSQSVREVWGIKTQAFHPVQLMLLSPNFWDGKGIGNKHYLFMVDGCRNDGSARGFYNEFLTNELEAHRKTMEIVGSKMRTEESDNQLSGLGFSSTARNSVLCKVKGAFTRTVKITF